MSGFAIELTYAVGSDSGPDSLGRLAAAFERAGDEVKDFGKHVFPRLVSVFEAELEQQFSDEGHGPMRGAWAPLSESYAKWKSANYPGATKLVRTGELRAALTKSGPNAKRVTTGDTFDFGTVGVPYASFHQLGTARMPVRPPFDFGPDFERKFQKAAQRGIIDAVRAAGLEATEGGA